MKVNKKIIICIISSLCMLCIISNFTYALDTSAYTDIYHSDEGTTSINNFAGEVLGVVQVIGMAVAVIMAIVLGIKYMASSPDMKATIKDKLVIYITGIVIIFASSALIGMIGKWANEAFTN